VISRRRLFNAAGPRARGPARVRDGRATGPKRDPARGIDRFFLWLVGIFVVALLLRLAILYELLRLPLHRTPQLDSLEFLIRAQRFRLGDFRPPVLPQHGPGYPAFVASVLSLFDGSIAALGVIQCVLGAGLCAMVAWLGRRWFGRGPGICAGFLLAFNGPMVLVGTSILSEGLLLFLLLLAMILFESRRSSFPRTMAAGGLVGLATAVRPTALLLLLILGGLGLSRSGESVRRRWLMLGVLLGSFLLVLSPVLIVNRRARLDPFLIQGNAGLSFYLGSSPAGRGTAGGRFGGSWDTIAGDAPRRGLTRAADQDRYYFGKALGEIRADPAGYVRLLGHKVLLTIGDEEVRDSHSYAFFADRVPLLRWLPGFGLLVALGGCGFAVAARRHSVPVLGLGYLLLFASTCVVLVVGTRYRIPLAPVAAIFAGLGAWSLIEAVRLPQVHRTVLLLAIAVFGWTVSRIARDPTSHRLAEEWCFTGNSLAKEGDAVGAEAAYRRALEDDRRFAAASTGIGVLAVKRGDWSSAESAFARAVRDDPAHARGHYWLGLALEHRGDIAGATRELSRARGLRPDDADTLRAMARVSSASGAWANAAAADRQLLRMFPDDADAELDLARAEAAQQHPQAAHAEAVRATELDPANADAWLLRGVLAIDLRDSADGRRSLERAESLVGTGRPPVEFAWALLERLEGKPAAVEARLKSLLGSHPDFSPAVQLLLETARQTGRLAQAEAFLRSLGASRGAQIRAK